jgi:hypothetical protein
VRGYNTNGIEVVAGGSGTAQPGAVNVTVTGNTAEQPGDAAGAIGLAKNGIHLNSGTTAGDSFQVCADVRGNRVGAGGAAPAGEVVSDIRLRQRQSTTVRVPGLLAGADAAAYVSSVNDAAETAVAGTLTPAPGACPAPN